jgi:hypothetical protein
LSGLGPHHFPGNAVTKTIPNYLRLHRGTSASSSKVVPPHDAVRCFWDAYSDVTGWRIDQRATRGHLFELIPAVNTETTDIQSTAAVSKLAATRLAESAARLAEELQRNREAMRRQEMELASRAPVLIADTDRARVADRIEKTLAEAAAACRCDAAAIYLLDEETQYLKARAVYGLPTQRLEEPARQLRGSRADLEAMVREVVAIDDLSLSELETWNSPEPFAAGICASIQTESIPIGTVWFFSKEKKEFTASESTTARFAAALIGFELSRASSEVGVADKSAKEPVRDLAQWQYESLPVGATLADGWRADGLIESPNDWATGWHFWDVLPDGTLMISIAEAVDRSVKGAVSAAVARAALSAHTGYRHTAAQLVQRISDTLWQTSTAEQLMSLFYARIDSNTGEGEFVSAGSVNAMIASRYGFRGLIDSASDPLNTHIDAHAVVKSFRLLKGETLLAYTAGFGQGGEAQMALGASLRSAMQSGDPNPLARVRRATAGIPLEHERGAITLLRE